MTKKAANNSTAQGHQVYMDEYFCSDRVQFKVLPTKANQDMEQAGADAAREYLERTGHNNLWVIYEAMTAAAPAAPAEQSWSPVKPVVPGAYWIRGNGLDQDALIQVIDDDGELRCNLHQRTTETDFGYGYAVGDLSDEFEWRGPLHSFASPNEVERLRYKSELYDEVWELVTGLGFLNVTTAISDLRTQLADLKRRHDGLHRDMATIAGREVPKGCTVADYAAAAIADALSPSAVPSAHAIPYPNRLCHLNYTAHPHRCGCLKGDEESQRIYDEHLGRAMDEPCMPVEPTISQLENGR